jgi:hypothetical protein
MVDLSCNGVFGQPGGCRRSWLGATLAQFADSALTQIEDSVAPHPAVRRVRRAIGPEASLPALPHAPRRGNLELRRRSVR